MRDPTNAPRGGNPRIGLRECLGGNPRHQRHGECSRAGVGVDGDDRSLAVAWHRELDLPGIDTLPDRVGDVVAEFCTGETPSGPSV